MTRSFRASIPPENVHGGRIFRFGGAETSTAPESMRACAFVAVVLALLALTTCSPNRKAREGRSPAR